MSTESTTSNFDFGNFLNDFISKGCNEDGTFKTVNTDYSLDDDDSDATKPIYDWRECYDKLAEEFKQYKARVASKEEFERRQLRRDVMKGFLEQFVIFLVNTYKDKKAARGDISDEDYLILKKMNDYLDSMGVVPMDDATGKEFDYTTMEAVVNDSYSSLPKDYVSKVVYNGFMMDGEVLLHQKVAVSDGQRLNAKSYRYL